MVKKALGKGLSALIPGAGGSDLQKGEKVKMLAVDSLAGNPDQPRKAFDEEKLSELAESIKTYGVVQPILVAQKGAVYEIVAGERRFRAAKQAGLKEIPCIIREFDAKELLEISLIENIQREDLNAAEEAESFRQLQQGLGYTQEQMAERLGKSRPYVANALRLLSLDEYCLKLLREGQMTAGHARAILSLPNKPLQDILAKKVVADALSVRRTEELAKEMLNPVPAKKKKKPALKKRVNAPILKSIESQFRYKLGTKVQMQAGDKGGKIVIEYYGDEDLMRLVDLLLPDADF